MRIAHISSFEHLIQSQFSCSLFKSYNQQKVFICISLRVLITYFCHLSWTVLLQNVCLNLFCKLVYYNYATPLRVNDFMVRLPILRLRQNSYVHMAHLFVSAFVSHFCLWYKHFDNKICSAKHRLSNYLFVLIMCACVYVKVQ